MSLNEYLNKEVTLKQLKSGGKMTKKQYANVIGLGLRGIDSESKLLATQSVLGMIKKVKHIVEIKA